MTVDYRNLIDFTDRVAVVTGAASGLGKEIATAIAQYGAHLVIADKNSDGLREAAKVMEGAASLTVVPTDVSQETEVRALFEGGIDNRRSAHSDSLCRHWGRSPAEDYPMELWDEVLAVNAGGTFLCTREASRIMLKQADGGAIVNLSSIGGMVGKPGSVAYQVSKAIEIQIAKSLGVEWGEKGVRVNSIAPGLFMTETIRQETEVEPDVNANFMKILPRKRAGEMSEIVGAALLLGSDAGSYVTGAIVPVDGGALAW